jgi:hypothetical protein
MCDGYEPYTTVQGRYASRITADLTTRRLTIGARPVIALRSTWMTGISQGRATARPYSGHRRGPVKPPQNQDYAPQAHGDKNGYEPG